MPIAGFAYDAAGRRVAATVAGVTTVYPFDHYEVAGTTVWKYYFVGGQRVAMRTDGALSYLLTDHLGSTNASAGASGVKTGELRYPPYGVTRYATGALPTARLFTGQERYGNIGRDYFIARWYDACKKSPLELRMGDMRQAIWGSDFFRLSRWPLLVAPEPGDSKWITGAIM